jgi:DNA (cytosine-5)-methyltransferase 1
MAAALATLSLPLDEELVVDLFAGGGGASEGIAMSYREPDVAVNHSPFAIAAHEANHPTTQHHQCDVFEVDPLTATLGRPVGMLWASPDCRHFSKAKGGAPRSARVRALAWVVLRWAFATRPRLITLENVEEFADWGPLDAAGQPIPERKSETYRAFMGVLTTGIPADHPAIDEIREYLGDDVPLAALVRGLGYNVESKELRACDFGTPTIRKRLFVVARADGQPVVWPSPTHAKPSDVRVLRGELLPYRTAAECIDWSIPTPSLWAPGRKLCAPNTMRRCVKGILRFVVDAEKPFIVPLRGTSAAHTSTHSVDEPLGTVSAGGTHHALTVPHLTEFANASTQRVFPADEPMRTQCSQVKGGHFAVVAPALVSTSHSTTTGRGPNAWDAQEPVRTIDASGGGFALSAPVLIEAAHSDSSPSGAKRWGSGVKDLEQPMGTIHAGGGNFALTGAALVGVGGRAGQSDPRPVDAPYHTTTTKADTAVITAHVTKFRANSIGSAADEPLHTITAGGNMKRPAGAGHAMGIVTAHMEQANGCHESPGHSVDSPVSTITGAGSQQRLVTAHLMKYYGSGGQWSDPADPLHTVPTKGRMAIVETVAIDADTLTPEQWRTARLAAALMREHAPERFPVVAGEPVPEIVMIGNYILVDIGLRMLRPRELARAQGFRDSYILDPEITITNARGKVVTRRLTATEQVRLIGNSVCPQVAAAIVRANLASLIALYASETRAA